MQFLATYLKLDQNFGGNEFGPYEDLEVTLGSDPSCNIVIPVDFGVLRLHAKLTRNSPTDIFLTPADQAARIFVWRGRARNASQIYAPTQVKSGDSFSLVSPNGPKFKIEFRELPKEVVEKRLESMGKRKGTSGRNRLSADSMKNEAKRQAWTSLLVSAPAQLAQRAYVFVVSGAIYQPRNIFLGLTIMGGYIFGGFTACRSKSIKMEHQSTITQYEKCEEDKANLIELTDDPTYSFETITSTLINKEFGGELKGDKEMKQMIRTAAKDLFFAVDKESDAYSWIVTDSEKNLMLRNYSSWIKSVKKISPDKLDVATIKVLTWLPPIEDSLGKKFHVRLNPEQKQVCGRGILKFTHRQARHLGLQSEMDALYNGRTVKKIDSSDNQITELDKVVLDLQYHKEKEEFLSPYFHEAEGDSELKPPETQWTATNSKTSFCVHETGGTDERTKSSVILKKIQSQYKRADMKDSKTLGKILRIYAADVINEDYSTIKDRSNNIKYNTVIGRELKKWSKTTPAANKVKEDLAYAVARSLVMPCIIKLKGSDTVKKKIFGDEEGPNPVMCFALNWRLSEE